MQVYSPTGRRLTMVEMARQLSSRDLARLHLVATPSHLGDDSPWERINTGDIIPENMPVHSGPYRETLGYLTRGSQERRY